MRWDENYKEPELINDPTIIPAYGVTDEERAYWNKKQEALEYDAYPQKNSDKHLISGVIWKALEDYKVQAVSAAQSFFWGQANGIEQAARRSENAVTSIAEAEARIAESETHAAASELNAADSAQDANLAAISARNSENNAASSESNALDSMYSAEAWAKGTRNGVPVDENDPTWHNNAEYFVTVMPTLIDDELTSQFLTWSSQKLSDALDAKADLVDGKVPASQLPSYVDDVIEYASIADFPNPGDSGKIYIAIDVGKEYRWSGTGYAIISDSIALGETASTAYAGNKGKANADAIASIQGKIPGTASTINLLATLADIPEDLSDFHSDAAHRLVSDNDILNWNNKAPSDHNHDDRYYTKEEINTVFAGVTFTEESGDIYINW